MPTSSRQIHFRRLRRLLSRRVRIAFLGCIAMMLGGCNDQPVIVRPTLPQAGGEPQLFNIVKGTASTDWNSMAWSEKRHLWATARYAGTPVLLLQSKKGGAEGVIHLGSPTTGTILRSAAAVVNSDGSLLASSLVTGTESHESPHLVIWKLKGKPTGQVLATERTDILALAFSPDSSLLAVATADNAVSLRSANDGAVIATLLTGQSEKGRALYLSFTPDGSHVWIGRRDGTLLFVAAPSMKTEKVFPPTDQNAATDELTGFAISPHGGTLIRGYLSGRIEATSVASGTTIFSKSLTTTIFRRVVAASFFSEGRFLLIATRSKKDKLLPSSDPDALTSEFFILSADGTSLTETITGIPEVEAMAVDDATATLMVAAPDGVQKWLLPSTPTMTQ